MRARRALLAVLLSALAATGVSAEQAPGLTADFGEKTGRYGHNVLGGNEYGGFSVVSSEGGQSKAYAIELPEDRVVEDVELRLADLTGDGVPEVVLVESSASGGASLMVYGGLERQTLEAIASTPPIGRRNRWLAPAGIADFNGDGRNDVAYVEAPHIGGTLRIWTMQDGELVQIAEQGGYSNHRIGEDYITGGVRDCGKGTELVLPDFGWNRLLAVRMEGGSLSTRTLSEKTDPATVDAALNCELK